MYHSGNQLLDPQLLFEKIQLQSGMSIADFGCGRTGHISFPAALIVGESGSVYAIDVQKDVLDNIRSRAKMDGLSQIHTVWSNLEQVGATAIPPQSIDIVCMVNLLGQAANPLAICAEASRLLKAKGRLLIVDWAHEGLSIAPTAEKLVNMEVIAKNLDHHGFVVQEFFDAGKYHRGVVLFRHE